MPVVFCSVFSSPFSKRARRKWLSLSSELRGDLLSVGKEEGVSPRCTLSCALLSFALRSLGRRQLPTEAQRFRENRGGKRGDTERERVSLFSVRDSRSKSRRFLFCKSLLLRLSLLPFPRYAGRATGCARRREALGCHRCCDVIGRRRRRRKSSRFGASRFSASNNKLCRCRRRQQWQRQQRQQRWSSSVVVVFSRRGKGRRCLVGQACRGKSPA